MRSHLKYPSLLKLATAATAVAAVALALALGLAPARADVSDRGSESGPGRVVVSLRSPDAADALVAAATRLGVSARRGSTGAAIVDTRGSADAMVVRMLAVAGSARSVEQAHRVSAAVVPSDPFYSSQWGLPAIGAPAAWDHTTGTTDVVVAVVDTGIQLDHPDLVARVDTVNDYDYVNHDAIANDDNGHGTHVAGIAAATMDNGTGGCGAAPGVTILPLKVLDASGNGWDSDVADAIRDAADVGADVINVSLGGPDYSSYLAAAVAYARDAGSVVVAAGGNNGVAGAFYPAAYPGALGVTAVDPALARAYFANWGPHIDIAAPGTTILSTTRGSGYGYMSGTSMAAPFVSGVAALMKSADPGSDATRIIDALQGSAIDLGSTGRDDVFGYGLVDAHDAIVHVTDHTPPSTVATGIPSGWSRGPVVATLIANDAASGVASTVVSTGTAGAMRTYVAPFQISAEGTTALSFRSVDRMGNKEQTRTAQVRIDDSAPLTSCDAVSNYAGHAVIGISATDPYSGVSATHWLLDGTPGTSNPVTVTVPGDHELLYYSVDAVGNREQTRTATFHVDPIVRHEETDPLLARDGAWTPSPAGFHSGGSYSYLNGAGSMTAWFDGTAIDWITTKDRIYGIASVRLDGGTPEDVDLYSATFAPQSKAWGVAGLAPGPHTVTIEWTGRSDIAAEGTYIGVDAFDVTGELVSAPSVASLYQETDTMLVKDGAWTPSPAGFHSGGSYSYLNGAGSMTAAFTGTAIDWITTRDRIYGIASVSLDGGTPEDVDLYASTFAPQSKAWGVSGLTDGPHTLTISWTGRSDIAAEGTYIGVDAFDVTGVLTAVPSSASRYEETDSLLAREGAWTPSPAGFHSGGSYSYLDGAGSMTAWFDGTGIDWITTRDRIYGIASVSVDGGTPEDVDLYSATFAPQSKAWGVSGLTDGPHRVSVTWTGRSNSSADGTYIGVDAFDVSGTLVSAP